MTTIEPSEPIALIGIGGIFPDAPDIPTFWRNVVEGKNSIIEVPQDRWDWRVFYDPDHSAPDKTYSKIGGFIRDFKFDPLALRIPPPVAAQMDNIQKMAVAATAEALRDSGYDKKPCNPERTAVILGNSMGGTKKEATDFRVYSALTYDKLSKLPAFSKLPSATKASILKDLEAGIQTHSAPITEDTMPGELSNVIAGRVANAFNFNGANFTVDAACASSLAALDQAVKGLRFHEYDMVVCGGVDQMMSPPAYVKFSKIGALSADGSRPFDAGANGFVMGEGVGVCVLKRLRDAVRDGDRIYALVSAIGSSSDGRGKGITAPNPKGQMMAIERAFKQVDYKPEAVGLLEAHGTSTKVGDVVEINEASRLFAPYASKGSIGLGSVKSQIGHLKAAAGIASLIKTALAIRHKTLPPSINFKTPNPGIDWEHSPFYVVTSAREWRSSIRRAHVSSFGFGGTNFHVALEEPVEQVIENWKRKVVSNVQRPAEEKAPAAAKARSWQPVATAGEVFLVHAASPEAIFDKLGSILQKLEGTEFSKLAGEVNSHRQGEYRLCFSAESPDKLREKIDYILKSKRADLWDNPSPAFRPKGIYLGRGTGPSGKIAFMFPGQGSQYIDMLKDVASRYEVAAETFDEADGVLEGLIGSKLTELLFTKGNESPERLAAMEERIKQTEVTQPAVLTADVALLRLLRQCGVEADMVCGHSLGEYGALVASDVLGFHEALLAVSARGKEMANVKVPDPGKMASIAAPIDKVEEVLKGIRGYVAPANKNCPSQTVIAGESKSIDAAVKKFNTLGIPAQEIRVSHAFHSKIVAPAQASYRKFMERMPIQAPRIPILSNVTAAYYPADPKEIRELLVSQIASPVEFIRQTERMRKDGVRFFVEVGPKRVLTAFVTSTLEKDKEAFALSSNHPKKGGINEFNELIARLDAEGVKITLPTRHQAVAEPTSTATSMQSATAPSTTPTHGWDFDTSAVVVSGIAAGTPGAWDRVFREDSLDQLMRGQNMIGKLADDDVQKQIDKNIVRLVKSATGDHRFERIQDAAEVVHLAALAGEFDLAKEFGFKESVANAMDITSKLAVAAGILALRDAGIPLVPVYKDTTTGGTLRTGWALPENMRDETGIIFASSFPSIDSMAEEVSRFLADKYRRKPLRELASVFESLITRLKDPEDRASVQAWYASSFKSYQERFGDQGRYEFSRDFLLRVLPIGHAQLAQWIGARGPATHISAACASTTLALGMAEDWIRLGRAKRVLVIAGDDVTGPNLREWIVTGFLTAGAATTSSIVSEAALPFDKRRHGMIVGMGASALVVEQGKKVEERGMLPLTEILSTEFANSAFHITRLHVEHVSEVMGRLVSKAEKRFGLNRKQIASKAMFMSHETYTPARGGSAAAEVDALKRTFGEDYRRIVVTNTKGFTGHSMGASIEDPASIRALISGRVPPIANYKEADPELEGLNLSNGGDYDLDYIVRLGAGFGSQIAMSLMRRAIKKGQERIADRARHTAWLRKISGQTEPQLEVVANTLRVRDPKSSPVGAPAARPSPAPAPVYTAAAAAHAAPAAAPKPAPAPISERPTGSPDESHVREAVVALISEKTGYPTEMLELDLDMEADLGIDTVKQAEFIGMIREKYDIPRKENLSLKDYPTLRHVIAFVMESKGGTPTPKAAPVAPAAPAARPTPAAPAPADSMPSAIPEEVKATVLKTVSEKTGYPIEMLELDLDMEADLGIDTVKQAELFGMIREKYDIPRKENLSLKDYPTLRHVINFVLDSRPAAAVETPARVNGAAHAAAVVKPSAVAAGDFKRWALKAIDRPTASGSFKPHKDPVLLLSAKKGAAEALAKAFKAAGQTIKTADAWSWSSVEDAAKAVAGEWSGIIYASGDAADPNSEPKKFDAAYRSRVRPLFLAAKAAQPKLTGRWLIALSAPDALGGAVTGLTKALKKELADCFVQSITIDGTKPDEAAKNILQDIGAREAQAEIRYTGVKRTGFTLEAKPATPAVKLGPGSVVVVTGGGQGLGAECAKELARRHKCRLIIVGRTPLSERAKEWAALNEAGLKALKQQMWEMLKADKTKKATPAILEKDFSAVTKAVALYRNISAMKEAGAKVAYLAADLADEAQVSKAFKAVSEKPDLILHAAGLEESKLLADKMPERFDAVFRAKAHAAIHLRSAVPAKKGQRWVFFSSVVGRFGNIGQVDYAAASDFLAKLSTQLRSEGVSSVTIDLTAIADIGMATRGGVEQFLKSQGVDFMPPKTAVDLILAESLGALDCAEVVLCGKLGVLDAEGHMSPPKKRTGPTLQEAVQSKSAQETVTLKEFTQEKDPWLKDHSIGGVPYVAGVMGLELFAQAGAEMNGAAPKAFQDVRFSLPLKLLRQKPLSARTYASADGKLRIESDFLTPQGIRLGGPRVHFTARTAEIEKPRWTAPAKKISGALAVKPEAIYSAYFHGPSFQVLEGIKALSEKELLGIYNKPKTALWHTPKELAFSPLLIEAAFQLCGYRDLHYAKKMTLPDSIGRVQVLGDATHAPDRLWVRAVHKGADQDKKSVYDAFVYDESGKLWIELTDYKMVAVS